MYISSMKRAKKKLTYFRVTAVAIAVLIGMLCVPAPTAADDLTDRYNTLQQQQKQQQATIDSNNAQLATAAQKKAALDKSINLIIQQTSILNSQISSLNAKIDSKNRDIAATQASIDTNFKLYKQRLRAMYETGDASYVNVLLSSASFTDFLSRAEVLRVVSQHDNKVIDDLKQSQAKLSADQASLKASQTSLLSTKSTLTAKQNAVGTQIAQQNQIVSQATQDVNAAKQQQQQIDAELNSVIAQIAAQNQSNSGSIALGNAGALISYAGNYNGCAYVWNAAGLGNPKTFDCSGFTMYVFAHFGIALDHFTVTQYNSGPHVSKSNLQPGDLVFFQTDYDSRDYYQGMYIDHVGIYTGSGNFIAANSSGVGEGPLFSSSYWGPRYIGATRILH